MRGIHVVGMSSQAAVGWRDTAQLGGNRAVVVFCEAWYLSALLCFLASNLGDGRLLSIGLGWDGICRGCRLDLLVARTPSISFCVACLFTHSYMYTAVVSPRSEAATPSLSALLDKKNLELFN